MKKAPSYHHERGYQLMCELLEDMEKSAVDLSQLTKAYRATVKPNVLKATRGQAKATNRLHTLIKRRGASPDVLRNIRNANVGGALPPHYVKSYRDADVAREVVKHQYGSAATAAELEAARKRMVGQFNSAGSRGAIEMPGDQSKAIRNLGNNFLNVPSNLSGESKNMINRITGLHEAAELKAAANKIKGGKYRGVSFETHQGPNPMLNDVNIANTLTGPGSKEVRELYMRMRRPELQNLRNMLAGDTRAEALIDKMLGGGRISRHGRKYLDRAHDNYLSKPKPKPKRSIIRRLRDLFAA